MIAHVFRPSRRVAGKRVRRRLFSGKFRLPGEARITYVALKTTDERVARQKLNEIITQRQHEAAGLIAPRSMREAASRRVCDHVVDFVADLKAGGRDAMYVYNIGKRLRRLCDDCGWRSLSDITAASFTSWRASAKDRRTKEALAPKTLNDYLDATMCLLNWLIPEKLPVNPLTGVSRAKTAGQLRREKRAFSDDEMRRFLKHAGEHRLASLTSSLTGLRRSELAELLWADVHLESQPPFISVHASTTKNAKTMRLPMFGELADELRRIQPRKPAPTAKVFPELPDMVAFRQIAERAKITERDGHGRGLYFHSLRKQFNTLLQRWGLPEANIMQLMRVSDRKLIDRTYLDQDALKPLPRGLVPWSCPRSQLRSQAAGSNGHAVAQDDTASTGASITKTAANGEKIGVSAVVPWLGPDWFEMRHLGLEPRTR